MDDTVVVEYAYDAWGKPMGVTGSMAGTLGAANPFRYRGYYYDSEKGLYYLNSRYYNPNWGRFINADSVLGQTGGLLSHNLFAYCGNDPVMGSDPGGNFWYYGNTQQSNSTSFEQAKKTDLLHKIKRKTKNQAIITAIEAGEKDIDSVSINSLLIYYVTYENSDSIWMEKIQEKNNQANNATFALSLFVLVGGFMAELGSVTSLALGSGTAILIWGMNNIENRNVLPKPNNGEYIDFDISCPCSAPGIGVIGIRGTIAPDNGTWTEISAY